MDLLLLTYQAMPAEPPSPAPPATSGWQIASVIVSTLAVLAALGIAVAGRIQERRDEERAALTQARLVIAHLGGGTEVSSDPEGNPQTKLGFTFQNRSERPVLEIYAEHWADDRTVNDEPRAVRSAVVEAGDTSSPLAMLIPGKVGEDFRLTAWRVRWTDADGRQWYRDASTGLAPARYTGAPPARPS